VKFDTDVTWVSRSLSGNQICDISSLEAALVTNSTLQVLMCVCSNFLFMSCLLTTKLCFSLSDNAIRNVLPLKVALVANKTLESLEYVMRLVVF
jgi:Leucine-rich repeat (LRR) protein